MPAGWYPDPDVDGARDRYWDGEDWTEDTRHSVEPKARSRRPGLRTPGDLLLTGAYALLASIGVAVGTVVLALLGAGDAVTDVLQAISGGLSLLFLAFVVGAVVAKVIQIGVRSAREDS